MSEENSNTTEVASDEVEATQERREFLTGLGKWSSAASIAAVGGVAWISSPGTAQAGWLNRRVGGGRWLNGGGGGWVNRRGGGGWLNRR